MITKATKGRVYLTQAIRHLENTRIYLPTLDLSDDWFLIIFNPRKFDWDEIKKTQEADLENYKGLFLIVGLVVTLAVCYGAIQYRSYEGDLMDLGQLDALEDDEIVPVTQRQQAPPPPPPPNRQKLFR